MQSLCRTLQHQHVGSGLGGARAAAGVMQRRVELGGGKRHS